MAAWNSDHNGSNGTYGSIENTGKLSWLSETPHRKENGSNGDESHQKAGRHWRRRVLLLLFAVLWICLFLALWQIRGGYQFDSNPFGKRYEYIVVGGGPSGILTATKLAEKLQLENPSCPGRVLLLESGTASQSSVLANLKSNPQESMKLNGIGFQLWDDLDFQINKFDIPLLWSGISAGQSKQESSDEDQKEETWSSSHWPIKKTLMAKGLGGAGLHNAMIYIRSLPSDFSNWNLSGWSWEDLLPYYNSLETYVDSRWDPPTLWNHTERVPHKRGTEGPIFTVPAGPSIDAVAPLFVQSSVASGWPLAVQGFNDPDTKRRVGAGYYEFNIRDGVRDSVAEALLGREKKPPGNLEIKTGATALKALIERDSKNTPFAVGIKYYDMGQGETHNVLLSKTGGEVLLAAGAIMTPQLLVNSGIGEHGSISNVPGVGKNLQDHPVVAMAFAIDPNLVEDASSVYTLASDIEDYFLTVKQSEQLETERNISAAQWKKHISHLGTLGTAGFSAGAFLKSPWATDGVPDIQLTVFPRIVEPHVRKRMGEDASLTSKSMLVTVALLTPEARYELQTSHPTVVDLKLAGKPDGMSYNYSLPVIDVPPDRDTYLSTLDVKRLAWGMEEVRRIRSFPPLSHNTLDELYPGTDITGAALKEYVQLQHLPNSHWVGTTKMGALEEDPMAVVDERLQVRGVKQLRVVDAGVIPIVPNGNTHSTVCVVASRAADFMWRDRVKHREA